MSKRQPPDTQIFPVAPDSLLGYSEWCLKLSFGGFTLKKLVFAVLLVLSLLAFSAAAAEMTGYISDAKCAKQDVAKAESDAHAGCAAGCAKKGAALVFVSGGKVYKLDDQAKVQDHAGHKVTITGKVEGDTLKIDSVKM